MVAIPNRLYFGRCYNKHNTRCAFSEFCIVTVRDKQAEDGEYYSDIISDTNEYFTYDRDKYGEPYYQVIGSFKLDFCQNSMVITEKDSLTDAILLVEYLSGEKMENGQPN
jgi:hypothetical protein